MLVKNIVTNTKFTNCRPASRSRYNFYHSVSFPNAVRSDNQCLLVLNNTTRDFTLLRPHEQAVVFSPLGRVVAPHFKALGVSKLLSDSTERQHQSPSISTVASRRAAGFDTA